ncbi:MAG: hypothetical protein HXO24_04150 [Prevotella sp.]|nr:hypothetical protein [Prevotella sp.]
MAQKIGMAVARCCHLVTGLKKWVAAVCRGWNVQHWFVAVLLAFGSSLKSIWASRCSPKYCLLQSCIALSLVVLRSIGILVAM